MEYKQRKANLIADNGKEEYDYALIPDTEINNVGTNLNNMNNLGTPEVQMSGVLDTKDKLVAQHDNSGKSTTLIY
ncbi:5719_t:CDS:2, partial [Gigaspora margarita]